MLACWHACRWPASEGGGEKCCLCCWHAPQHASTPSCWHAGMLGCKPAAQTDQHDNNRGAGRSSVAVAVDACVYPSTQHPAPCHFGVQPRMLALWPCTFEGGPNGLPDLIFILQQYLSVPFGAKLQLSEVEQLATQTEVFLKVLVVALPLYGPCLATRLLE